MGRRWAALSHAFCFAARLIRSSNAWIPDRGTSAAAAAIATRICPRKTTPLSRHYQACPLVVDDESLPEAWQPWWSYSPSCVVVGSQGEEEDEQVKENDQDQLQGDEEDEDKEDTTIINNGIKFCVFTNSFFGNHGISMIVTPEKATDTATIIQELHDSAFPSPETVHNLNLEPAWEVVDMPAKGGKGVVALRHIRRLETFMLDYASIVADVNIWGAISQTQALRLLNQGAEQLAIPDEVLALSRSRAPGDADAVDSVIKTNAFRDDLAGLSHKVLFPMIAVKSLLL